MQTEWQGYRINSLTPAHILRVIPEPGFPDGRRSQLTADLWASHGAGHWAGMLWLDCDVAADPDDLAAMAEAVKADPEQVYTGMIKLWPRSTGAAAWFWSHRAGPPSAPICTQAEVEDATNFALGFLWTPARLMNLALPWLRSWRYREIDCGLSELAWRHDIRARAVLDCRPKHLHY